MSATLDADPIVRFLDDCPRVQSEGRRFDVRIEHATKADDRPLQVQVTEAVRKILRDEATGDVLVFLPGNADIRRCEEALAPIASSSNLLVLPLHGDLTLPAQARAVAPAARRKVILSTNVAETSVTIEGVVAVVDSGLARIAGHSPWTGLPTLALSKVSQASAIQRAGRAGRTRPGVAVRLFTRADFDARRTHDVPEIERSDLTELVLTLHALGVADPHDLDWLTVPPLGALKAASDLLRRLGALDGGGTLTERGRRMLHFPTHPRLARLLIEGEDRGVPQDAATLAALLGERDPRQRGGQHIPSASTGKIDGGIDIIALLELFDAARAARFSPDRLRSLGLDPRATQIVEQARRQFANLVQPSREAAGASSSDRRAMDQALGRAALAGFPDRVARRREGGSRAVILAAGGTAELAYEADTDFMVALDAEERTAGPSRGGGKPGRSGGGAARGNSGDGGMSGRAGTTVIRLGCGIDPDWLGDLEGDDLRASETLEFDATTERVVRRSRLTFQALTLDETVRPAEPVPEVGRILADAALARGVAAFDDPGALSTLAARLAVLSEIDPALSPPTLDDATLKETLSAACEGLRSFAELREVGIAARIVGALPPRLRSRLASDVPTNVTLPGGRTVRVNYQAGQPPWIESRLQDFFGMAKVPAIAAGRMPLTLHLLAPNGRAVQVTRDLDSFWRQHYPPLRRELGRRYPRHSWPEDGRTASPPPPLPPRRGR